VVKGWIHHDKGDMLFCVYEDIDLSKVMVNDMPFLLRSVLRRSGPHIESTLQATKVI
jgi:hypothetical protein